MADRVGRKIEIEKACPHCSLLGVKPGVYEVLVGDYGWEDGDLYINTNKGKVKLKDLAWYRNIEYG
jgi:hypothetical protein